MSCRDGQVFFDQLGLPDDLRAYMGRPSLLVAKFIDPSKFCGERDDIKGSPLEELALLVIDGPLDAQFDELTPVNETWPMGFAWSSLVT